MVTRRTVLKGGAALGLGGMLHGGVSWSRTDESVRMILPSVTHDTIALKVLLDRPPAGAPQLAIDGRSVAGKATDGDGYAWQFVQNGLKGGTPHMLALRDDTGRALREPWQFGVISRRSPTRRSWVRRGRRARPTERNG